MSSGSSASVQLLEFPEEYSSYNVKKTQCSSREVAKRKPSLLTTHDMGIPQIMTIKKRISRSSTANPSSTLISYSKTVSIKSPRMGTSRNLTDSQHKKSIKSKRSMFAPPCSESVVLGAPKSHIGYCQHTKPITHKNLFSLTENPRKRFCLRNPGKIHFKPIPIHVEQAKIRELIKNADNRKTPSGSQSTNSSICEEIDLANPLNLDFQGLDYKNTYVQDEQSLLNQMEYRKVRRLQHRRNVKAETVRLTDKQQQEERISVPKHLTLQTSKPDKSRPQPDVNSKFFGKLIRAENKPSVLARLEKEEENRKRRYKQLYLKKKEKLAQTQKEKSNIEQMNAASKAKDLAMQDIQDFLGLLDRTALTKKLEPRQIPRRRNFPYTITESLKLRHQLKKSKRILRDRAKVKQAFYMELGKPKTIPEAQLDISSDSPSPSSRNDEQSSNDEDNMQVGQQGSQFLLRGFHYKLTPNLRGKLNQKERDVERKVRGCITRAEWFESLVAQKKKPEIKAQQQVPGMDLFPKALGFKAPVAESPIKEFRMKPLGRHYDRAIRKTVHIKKPKRINVKKFNLIGYLYGVDAEKKFNKSMISLGESARHGTTSEHIQNKVKLNRLRDKMKKRRRMHYLGIPYGQSKQKRTKANCVDSETEDSEWIPDDENYNELLSTECVHDRSNMPAPEYRETTLRCHPRHPRNYRKLRVDSEHFLDYVKKQGIPIMGKLKDDKIITENVRAVKKSEYATKFENRHHHDHWNPTQHKFVYVRYATKVPEPKLQAVEGKEDDENISIAFDKARPRGDNLEEVDFTLPQLNTDDLIKEYKTANTSFKSKAQLTEKTRSQPKVFRSIEDGEQQEFPGRDKFVEFIAEIRSELNKRSGLTDPELVIDKKAYLDELQEDLRSIESCLTSLSSSKCSNLSNDSGSFLMAGDRKIPLDFIRKSLVPFEEVHRSRFGAVPIDAAKEALNPYHTVPFAGQRKEQQNMNAAKDSFFTFNTRLQNGLRLRLEVSTVDPRKKLIGTSKGIKANAQVATDIDELYVEDLHKRPKFKPFKWNSCRTIIKDALRKKFESMLIQGEIVRAKIYDRRNEEDFATMMEVKELINKLFAKWEKKEYDSSMEMVNKIKPYYEASDKFRREVEELSKQYTVLNMEIVYIENDWMRRTILQNFHYLLADMEWRVKHDWIHQTSDGEMEGFQESIAKRNTTNIRKRDKDDAWAIKEYFENVYLQNPHPIIVVFENANEFINGIEDLKTKTFVLLLELHYTLWILAELAQKYQEFSDWCIIELESKKTYAVNKCAKKYFMEDRATRLRAQVGLFLGQPIQSTFGDKRLAQIKGICNEVYADIVPQSAQLDIGSLEQIAAISEFLVDLIGQFEDIPLAERKRVDKNYRKLLQHRRNMSKQAVLIERRIASEMVKVRHNLAPPFQKPKRPIKQVKLPRSELKKVVRTVRQKPIKISDKTTFFYKAFHEDGDLKSLKEARESLEVMDTIQESIVPFYFDHFLRINNYQPNYNFKTDIELRDGPEIERFKIKAVLPQVLEKFENWQMMKQRTMEENINKHPEMYNNVQT